MEMEGRLRKTSVRLLVRTDLQMLQKNIDKNERRNRPKQWKGLYTRKTKTKKDKENQEQKKYFQKIKEDYS